MIPSQLLNNDFRLIKISPHNRKVPLEKNWTTTANYLPNDPVIIKWVEDGQNYGVATGYGNLIVIDSDDKQLQELVEQHLPETFKVQTGGGGYHNYYICEGQDKVIFENGNQKHLGELQSNGQQVIAPGSIHPNGQPYKIINNHEITSITKEDIQKLPNEIFKKQVKEEEVKRDIGNISQHNLNVTDVIPLHKLHKKPNGEYQGKHPLHGSDTGNNFTVNPTKNVWYCFRHNCGGSALDWIGIEEGIISCGEKLEGNKFKKVIKKAKKKYGYKNFTQDEINEIVQAHDYSRLKGKIYNALKDNDSDNATEFLVQQILEEEYIYTIRDDDKPEVWIYNDGIYTPNGVTHIHEKIREILGELCTTYLQNKTVFKIQADTYIEQREFFKHNIVDEIPVLNGILNTRTKELKPYNPDKLFFTKIPVKYDTTKDCPHIKQFLKDVLKNPEDLPLMQELFGYLLWKEYNIEKAFMLIGTGRNGKGKTIELMKRFIGHDNYSSVPLQNLESDQFSKCELHNKLANLCGDIDDRALKFTGSFKMLTGRDTISADRKFKTRVHFENFAKMVFAANNLPTTRDLSDGFFMRWILLEFPYKFVTQEDYKKVSDIREKQYLKIRDPNIINKIATEDELSGLLNWALEGLSRLQKNKDFSYSKSADDVKNMWIRKSDSFTAFCMDVLEEEYGNEIEKSEIRHTYTEYCKQHKLKPKSDNHIKDVLTTLFGAWESRTTNYDDKRVLVWVGIKYKPPKQEQGNLK